MGGFQGPVHDTGQVVADRGQVDRVVAPERASVLAKPTSPKTGYAGSAHQPLELLAPLAAGPLP